MTAAELDEWIITKTDSAIIWDKMKGTGSLAGLGCGYLVRLHMADHGVEQAEAMEAVRKSLMRLLRAGRIFAVSINAWSTVDGPKTPQRIYDIKDVLANKRPYTTDLTWISE
jgi:hypothetical protein